MQTIHRLLMTMTLPVLGLMAVSASIATAQDEYGTIKGQVVWAGEEIPDLPPKVAQGDQSVKNPEVCAVEEVPDDSLVIDEQSKGVRYCLVYLYRPTGENPEAVESLVEEQPEVVVDQKGCQFLPHVVALHEDQDVLFKSSDPAGHNVRLQGFNNPALNVMMQPNGELRQDVNAERRPMPLSCDIHPWMQGYVMVLDHLYFAVTDEQGNFEIPGVPPGTQNIVVWHEKVGYVTPGLARGFEIPVEAGKETKIGPIEISPDQIK